MPSAGSYSCRAEVTIRAYAPRDAGDLADVFFRSVRQLALSAYRAGWFRASPPDFGEQLREGPALVVASSRGLQTR